MLLLVAALLSAPQITEEKPAFDPRLDARMVESCMGTLATLQAVADHQDDQIERKKGERAAAQLRMGLRPYLSKTIDVIGADEFWTQAVLLHRDVTHRLDDLGFVPIVRTAIERDLLIEAERCEVAIGKWNAVTPPREAKGSGR